MKFYREELKMLIRERNKKKRRKEKHLKKKNLIKKKF